MIDSLSLDDLNSLAPVLFKKIAECISSPQFQVAERALSMLSNEYILQLISQTRGQTIPILFMSLYANTKTHWNNSVISLTFSALKLFMEMDGRDQKWELIERVFKDKVEKGAGKKPVQLSGQGPVPVAQVVLQNSPQQSLSGKRGLVQQQPPGLGTVQSQRSRTNTVGSQNSQQSTSQLASAQQSQTGPIAPRAIQPINVNPSQGQSNTSPNIQMSPPSTANSQQQSQLIQPQPQNVSQIVQSASPSFSPGVSPGVISQSSNGNVTPTPQQQQMSQGSDKSVNLQQVSGRTSNGGAGSTQQGQMNYNLNPNIGNSSASISPGRQQQSPQGQQQASPSPNIQSTNPATNQVNTASSVRLQGRVQAQNQQRTNQPQNTSQQPSAISGNVAAGNQQRGSAVQRGAAQSISAAQRTQAGKTVQSGTLNAQQQMIQQQQRQQGGQQANFNPQQGQSGSGGQFTNPGMITGGQPTQPRK
ncbi:MAG: putative serine threonine-protein phosphatase 2a 56 kda regulatory subunit delta [Streblomastix strix]|uniref:Putative serine threonine-protein phosphatase 2a 56 kDa regulatory subunit delta n=1 Tax=Streblomastix strix TaxID=222440 RepID=A0A5J4V4M5_9EUKA|nr:MAG: putative serine threonine-protein phosphatase 2a 56 kda regulatory subunit delta [Streblomastix strix]